MINAKCEDELEEDMREFRRQFIQELSKELALSTQDIVMSVADSDWLKQKFRFILDKRLPPGKAVVYPSVKYTIK